MIYTLLFGIPGSEINLLTNQRLNYLRQIYPLLLSVKMQKFVFAKKEQQYCRAVNITQVSIYGLAFGTDRNLRKAESTKSSLFILAEACTIY